jgi:hypothetical protein
MWDLRDMGSRTMEICMIMIMGDVKMSNVAEYCTHLSSDILVWKFCMIISCRLLLPRPFIAM